jgi:His/Glu/Gln/Arg/opine family amino acid ABC transporter permease subunit
MESLSKLTIGASGWGDELLLGALMTVSLALASVAVGLVIGGKLAFLKIQPNKLLRGMSHGVTLLFRGTPEFLVILVVFFWPRYFDQCTLTGTVDRADCIDPEILGWRTRPWVNFWSLCIRGFQRSLFRSP